MVCVEGKVNQYGGRSAGLNIFAIGTSLGEKIVGVVHHVCACLSAVLLREICYGLT